MSQEALSEQATKSTEAQAQADPFEDVPPGCGTPRAWWPFWLGLVGFVAWVAFLLALLAIRWQTSVV